MENNILKKDKVGMIVLFVISIFSCIVSLLNIVTLLYNIISLTNKTIDIYTIELILNDYNIFGVVFAFIQLFASIKLLLTSIKRDNVRQYGQTSVLCYSITLPHFTAILVELIFSVMNGKYEYILTYIKPIFLMTFLFVLTVCIRRNVLKKKYIALSLLQFSMSIISILYFVLNWNMIIDTLDNSSLEYVIYYLNIGILGLLLLESIATFIHLLVNKEELYETIENELDCEILSEKNGFIIEKVYIEKGVNDIYSRLSRIFVWFFIVFGAAFLIFEIINNWNSITEVDFESGMAGLSLINSLKLMYMIMCIYYYFKLAIGLLFIKKEMYLDITIFITRFMFLLIFNGLFSLFGVLTILFDFKNLNVFRFDLICYAIGFVILLFIGPILKRLYPNVKESLRSGEFGSQIMNQVAMINVGYSIPVGIMCLGCITNVKSMHYILIILIVLILVYISVSEVKHPVSKYYIRKRKIKMEVDVECEK